MNDLSRKGKEDCRNSWRCLRSTRKWITCWTLAWISSNPFWGGPFFPRAKFARGPNGLQNGKPPLRRSTRKSGALDADERHPPFPRGWVAGAECSRGPTVERERSKKKKIKKKKIIVDYFISIWDTGSTEINLFWYIHPAELFASHLHLISIPRGIRVRVRVRKPNPSQFPWDPLPWQPIVYSCFDWSMVRINIQPIVSRLLV